MVVQVKKILQRSLLAKAKRNYDERIKEQTISYDSWIREKEKQELENFRFSEKELSVTAVPLSACGENFSLESYDADLIVFHGEGGEMEPMACKRAADYFVKNPETVIAYADEDEVDEKGIRQNPWLKPDWSPDTLISYFYFNHFFVIRRKECLGIPWKKEEDWRRNVYDFVLRAVEIMGKAGHIDSVLFHNRKEIEPFGQQKEFDDLKKEAYIRRGWPLQDDGLVSVIIPSKDNPRVLSTCIHSLVEGSSYRNFEIIVVDNGSSPKNRARIERMRDMMKEEYQFTYHYEPMEFNFSKMCNIGASMARGKYILLLNDDIEIIQEDWLDKMVAKAALPHVGAVGVKLLYPQSDTIQHAGITNIHLGPAHKLQFRSDKVDYYFLHNRLAFDVLGVTGACLLVRKEVYEKAGGLLEELRVSFNDVEFCYHLHEMGYVNVVCNDVKHYHHESLSRGSDDSVEKLKRLHQELNLLYEKHPSVYGTDPYYHRYLVKDVLDQEFLPGNLYDYETRVEKVVPEKVTEGLPAEWHNEVLRMGIEFAGDLHKWKTGAPGEEDYFIQGWAFALQVDNCRYRFNLLLKPNGRGDGPAADGEKGTVWKLPCSRQYRPDIYNNLQHLQNVKLTGVCLTFDRKALPEGEYLIGFLWEDTCSRQRLYRWSAETIQIG